MATDSTGMLAFSAQAFLLLSLISLSLSAKLPAAEQKPDLKTSASAPVIQSLPARSVPIVASTDEFEVVAHTGPEGLGRQKRYIGWGRRPSLRYSKATSIFDHDNLFNKIHNNFDKRMSAPTSNFRELRMKQKVPNIQLLLPHLQMRQARVPADTDADDVPPGVMINDLENGKLTPEDLDTLAYLLNGDMQ